MLALSSSNGTIRLTQEITFAPGEREARFHTTSGNIGPAMDTHIHARRSDGSAANIVPMTT